MGDAGNKIKLLKNINKYEMPAITGSIFVLCALAAVLVLSRFSRVRLCATP